MSFGMNINMCCLPEVTVQSKSYLHVSRSDEGFNQDLFIDHAQKLMDFLSDQLSETTMRMGADKTS